MKYKGIELIEITNSNCEKCIFNKDNELGDSDGCLTIGEYCFDNNKIWIRKQEDSDES